MFFLYYTQLGTIAPSIDTVGKKKHSLEIAAV